LQVEQSQKRDQPQVHDAGGDQDAAGKEVGTQLALCPPRQHKGGGRGGISAAQQCRQYDAALALGHLL